MADGSIAKMVAFLIKSLVSGSAVSAVTTGALALLARAEGRHPIRPVNSSTSHWYWGEAAGCSRAFDLGHTLLGFATHQGASVFWGAIFQVVRRARPDRSPVLDAVAVSALAAVVDYAVVPKRLTPGWEKVVSPTSIALTYAAMAVGLLATCSRAQQKRDRE